MNITYDLVFQPDVRRALSVGREPQLTAAILEQALPGCGVVDPIEDQWGPRRVHIQHDGIGGLIWPHCGGLKWPHLRPTGC